MTSGRPLNPERAAEIVALTIGGTVAAEDVGVTIEEARAFAELCRHDPDLAVACAELAASATRVREALIPPAGAVPDDALARRIAAALPHGRLRTLPRVGIAAALVAALLLVGLAVFSPRSGTTTDDVGVARFPADYPLTPPPCDDWTGPRFTDVTAASGIRAIDHTGLEHSKDWMVEVVGHGAAVLDIDGDGDLDLFVPDGNRVDEADRVHDTWRLYRNDGDLRFSDITADSGLASDAWAGGSVAGDLDADGRPDLFVACFGRNHLFRNLGGGRFEDVTDRAGVAGRDDEWSTAAALGDVDGDGDLDLYVSNYADMRRFMVDRRVGRDCVWRDLAVPCGPQPLEPQRDRLYVNQGDGTFVDESDDRVESGRRYSFQPVMADLDDDGDLDVFVAADGHPNLLLLNDGTGHFVDHAREAGCASDGRGMDQACMGVAAGDVDGDGRLDLLVTNFSHEPNVLYRARPAGAGVSFADVTAGAGLAAPSRNALGWGTVLLDVDRDGDLDALTANGHLYPDVRDTAPETSYAQHVALFRNAGDGTFDDVTAAGGAALGGLRAHRGLVAADFDDDGDADVFVTALNGPPALLRNDGRGAGGGVRVELRRADGRTEAPGARVTARTATPGGERVIHRTALLGTSFGCSEDPRVVLGMGSAARADVVVRWPARAGAAAVTESFGTLEAGGSYVLVEGTGH